VLEHEGRLLAGAKIRGGLQYIFPAQTKGGPGHEDKNLGREKLSAFGL
jgi:hypothetical protein